MPYLYPGSETNLIIGGNYLVHLTGQERAALLAIAPQLRWTKEYTPGEWAESAEAKLVGALDMQELIQILNDMKDCICQSNEERNTAEVYRWQPGQTHVPMVDGDGNPVEYPVFGGGRITVGQGSPPANTGASDWLDWRDYQCKAAELVRRSVILTVEEFQSWFDLPSLTLGIIGAALGAVALVAIGLTLPVSLFTVGALVSMVSAVISAGEGTGEVMRDFAEDQAEQFWPYVACVMSSSPHSLYAADRVREYISANTSLPAATILNLIPWEDLIEQCYQGRLSDGTPLNIAGIPSLCSNCDEQEVTGFKGTSVVDCELEHWEASAFWGVGLYDGGVICQGSGVTIPQEYSDGMFGGSQSNPLTATSSPFARPAGTYRLAYRAKNVDGHTDGSLAMYIHNSVTGDLITYQEMAVNDENNNMIYSQDFELDSNASYVMTVVSRYVIFETYDNHVLEQ